MKIIIALLFCMNAYGLDRTYDRQIPADRNLSLNGLTVNGNSTVTGSSSVANNSTSSTAAGTQTIIGALNTATSDKLVVYGSVVTPSVTQSGTSFDFFKSGTINCSSCGATSGSQTVTLTGLSDGGFYTLDMTDSSTVTNTFSSAGLTFVYNPANAARTTGTIASYSLHRVGTKVLVSLLEF